MTVGTTLAKREGLDALIDREIPRVAGRDFNRFDFFFALKEYLSRENNRLETVLEILRHPSVLRHLRERYSFKFDEAGPRELEDVIWAAPETGTVYAGKIPEKVLLALGNPEVPELPPRWASFAEAERIAWQRRALWGRYHALFF